MQKNNKQTMDATLTKEQKKQISDSVNRYFRMRRKRIIRKAGYIILYPIKGIWKQKT